jgi:hypothetical protein
MRRHSFGGAVHFTEAVVQPLRCGWLLRAFVVDFLAEQLQTPYANDAPLS